ncbi:YfiT family bacillithiol transferase [Cellulophaga omnivescoria]|uniref:YfiT family bacillithiol transferase n=1 Tax=Cellulophaga omnivescoria TaxID=1888890 RepID=UPI0009861924|nr:putative metal-dependent hydrolase [Cellulophaga omnivescoria]WBU89546.1 putative metal-dependent hydrolase [Cellulophaga omnivescoria]
MKSSTLKSLQYPIGVFSCPKDITKEQIKKWIKTLESFPVKLTNIVLNLNNEQLNTPYRPNGWTVIQLVHHIADSHHNSYTRFKWALTEDAPLIKAYEEKDWANLVDASTSPVILSLNYITALHAKLVFLLKGLSDSQLNRYFIHPSGETKISVAENIGSYAWHSKHHYAHIKNLCVREGWL